MLITDYVPHGPGGGEDGGGKEGAKLQYALFRPIASLRSQSVRQHPNQPPAKGAEQEMHPAYKTPPGGKNLQPASKPLSIWVSLLIIFTCRSSSSSALMHCIGNR